MRSNGSDVAEVHLRWNLQGLYRRSRPRPYDQLRSRSAGAASIYAVFLKKAYAGWSHRIHEQRPIQKEVSSLAARLCNDETTVAGSTVKSSVVGGSRRVVISTNGIAGAQP